MIEILKTALPLAEIAIIKRDFDLLRKLLPSLTSDVQTQMAPYSALFCYEAMVYLKKYDPSSKYSIKDIRQKAKFFDFTIRAKL